MKADNLSFLEFIGAGKRNLYNDSKDVCFIAETKGVNLMCTISQLNSISRQMVECYRSVYGKDIADIFLYGSYARGDNDSDSDIDIAAIVKGNRVELQQKLKEIWDISADIGLENDVVVSPIVIPYDEFVEYKEKLPYYMNIVKEGRKIG